MSGEFVHHECPRCQGFGVVPSVSLWDDLVACPLCDGDGVLYEYSAGEEVWCVQYRERRYDELEFLNRDSKEESFNLARSLRGAGERDVVVFRNGEEIGGWY